MRGRLPAAPGLVLNSGNIAWGRCDQNVTVFDAFIHVLIRRKEAGAVGQGEPKPSQITIAQDLFTSLPRLDGAVNGRTVSGQALYNDIFHCRFSSSENSWHTRSSSSVGSDTHSDSLSFN
jgi:hypothetical protein